MHDNLMTIQLEFNNFWVKEIYRVDNDTEITAGKHNKILYIAVNKILVS